MTNASRPRRAVKRKFGPPTKAMRRLMRNAVNSGGMLNLGILADQTQGTMLRSLIARGLVVKARHPAPLGWIITEDGRKVAQEKP